MEKQHAPASAPAGFAAACEECGSVSHERQYVRSGERHTCEHCLLSSRKRRGGLESDQYELFVESLAEALDLRERETGLHSQRVATHTLLLAAHHYLRMSGSQFDPGAVDTFLREEAALREMSGMAFPLTG